MSPPKKAQDRGQLPPKLGNFVSGPRELPDLRIPDAINNDIHRAAILASQGVMIQSEDNIQDAKSLLGTIMETMEKMKTEKGGPEQDDDTWTFKAYNEIAAIYGVLEMPQKEKEISKNLLLMMEARRGPDDQETLFIVQRDALRYWEWGNLEEAVLLFERAEQGQSKEFGEDSFHVIKNTMCLAASALALSLKYAGEGKEEMRAEKRRQSNDASERVADWEGKQPRGGRTYLLLQSMRQIIQGKLHNVKAGSFTEATFPNNISINLCLCLSLCLALSLP